jgi:N-methylhydantoinase A
MKKSAPKRVLAAREKTFARSSDYTMTYFERKKVRTGVYRREEFLAGMKLHTPCIVTEYSATTLIPSDARASVDRYGNLIIEATA